MTADVRTAPTASTARPFELPTWDNAPPPTPAETVGPQVAVAIEFGRTNIATADVDTLRDGALIALGNEVGEMVDVYIDGKLAARGDVLVMNGRFCVRVVELVEIGDESGAR
jgi:flagellar motor switch protein FliN